MPLLQQNGRCLPGNCHSRHNLPRFRLLCFLPAPPMLRRLFLIGLLALAACASHPAATSQTQRYSGTLDWGFETSSFRTDDGQGPYWLSSDTVWNQVVAPLRTSGHGPWGRVHLVVEGVLSPSGAYGQMGSYQHELKVTRVIESRLLVSEPSGS